MPRDGDATRARILAAATDEFAAHGIAGARVDRIAEEARANKAQLYSYFGSKEGLFDRIYAEAAEQFVIDVPIDPSDLPGFAARLYDAWMKNPHVARLQTWARLERRPDGHLIDKAAREQAYQLGRIVAEQKADRIRNDVPAEDLVSMILALSLAWAPTSLTFVAHGREAKAAHTRRRAELSDAVRRLIAPGPSEA